MVQTKHTTAVGCFEMVVKRTNQPIELFVLCCAVFFLHVHVIRRYTDFWPGSHRYKDLLGFGPAAPVLNTCYAGICNAGDAVM